MTLVATPADRLNDLYRAARNFVITGGDGFVARHLTSKLTSLGQKVRVLSRTAGFDVTTDDLALDHASYVFHLAARTGVVESWQDPPAFLHVNVYGTARVLEQCRRHDCPVTFLSSFRPDIGGKNPAGATMPAAPNPYLLSKAMAEQLCEFYHQRWGLRVVTLRMANIYGPGQPTSFLIPHIVAQLVDSRTAEILVQDLAPARDYVHVADAVDAILLSTQAAPGSLYNIGSGASYTVERIVQIAGQAAGIPKPYRATGPARRGEVGRTSVDDRAFQQAVGWRPTIPIESGIRSVIESMQRC